MFNRPVGYTSQSFDIGINSDSRGQNSHELSTLFPPQHQQSDQTKPTTPRSLRDHQLVKHFNLQRPARTESAPLHAKLDAKHFHKDNVFDLYHNLRSGLTFLIKQCELRDKKKLSDTQSSTSLPDPASIQLQGLFHFEQTNLSKPCASSNDFNHIDFSHSSNPPELSYPHLFIIHFFIITHYCYFFRTFVDTIHTTTSAPLKPSLPHSPFQLSANSPFSQLFPAQPQLPQHQQQQRSTPQKPLTDQLLRSIPIISNYLDQVSEPRQQYPTAHFTSITPSIASLSCAPPSHGELPLGNVPWLYPNSLRNSQPNLDPISPCSNPRPNLPTNHQSFAFPPTNSPLNPPPLHTALHTALLANPNQPAHQISTLATVSPPHPLQPSQPQSTSHGHCHPTQPQQLSMQTEEMSYLSIYYKSPQPSIPHQSQPPTPPQPIDFLSCFNATSSPLNFATHSPDIHFSSTPPMNTLPPYQSIPAYQNNPTYSPQPFHSTPDPNPLHPPITASIITPHPTIKADQSEFNQALFDVQNSFPNGDYRANFVPFSSIEYITYSNGVLPLHILTAMLIRLEELTIAALFVKSPPQQNLPLQSSNLRYSSLPQQSRSDPNTINYFSASKQHNNHNEPATTSHQLSQQRHVQNLQLLKQRQSQSPSPMQTVTHFQDQHSNSPPGSPTTPIPFPPYTSMILLNLLRISRNNPHGIDLTQIPAYLSPDMTQFQVERLFQCNIKQDLLATAELNQIVVKPAMFERVRRWCLNDPNTVPNLARSHQQVSHTFVDTLAAISDYLMTENGGLNGNVNTVHIKSNIEQSNTNLNTTTYSNNSLYTDFDCIDSKSGGHRSSHTLGSIDNNSMTSSIDSATTFQSHFDKLNAKIRELTRCFEHSSNFKLNSSQSKPFQLSYKHTLDYLHNQSILAPFYSTHSHIPPKQHHCVTPPLQPDYSPVMRHKIENQPLDHRVTQCFGDSLFALANKHKASIPQRNRVLKPSSQRKNVHNSSSDQKSPNLRTSQTSQTSYTSSHMSPRNSNVSSTRRKQTRSKIRFPPLLRSLLPSSNSLHSSVIQYSSSEAASSSEMVSDHCELPLSHTDQSSPIQPRALVSCPNPPVLEDGPTPIPIITDQPRFSPPLYFDVEPFAPSNIPSNQDFSLHLDLLQPWMNTNAHQSEHSSQSYQSHASASMPSHDTSTQTRHNVECGWGYTQGLKLQVTTLEVNQNLATSNLLSNNSTILSAVSPSSSSFGTPMDQNRQSFSSDVDFSKFAPASSTIFQSRLRSSSKPIIPNTFAQIQHANSISGQPLLRTPIHTRKTSHNDQSFALMSIPSSTRSSHKASRRSTTSIDAEQFKHAITPPIQLLSHTIPETQPQPRFDTPQLSQIYSNDHISCSTSFQHPYEPFSLSFYRHGIPTTTPTTTPTPTPPTTTTTPQLTLLQSIDQLPSQGPSISTKLCPVQPVPLGQSTLPPEFIPISVRIDDFVRNALRTE